MIKNIIIIFFLSVFFIGVLDTSHAQAETITRFDSLFGYNCNDVCIANNLTCSGITNDQISNNNFYCDFDETQACNNFAGSCNTVFSDTGLTCFDRSTTPECGVDLFKNIQWTYCLCSDSVIATTSAINKLDIGKEYIENQDGTITIVYKPFNLFLFIAICLFFVGMTMAIYKAFLRK